MWIWQQFGFTRHLQVLCPYILQSSDLHNTMNLLQVCNLNMEAHASCGRICGRSTMKLIPSKACVKNEVPGKVKYGASLAVSLMAAALASCPPASLSASLNSTNAMCSLRGVQANGYEYAYPESWVRDKIRGIEVLAHDPEVAELNMSIFTGPAQSGTLSGSAAEVGEAIIAQYKKSPAIEKVELLGVDLMQDGGANRSYSVELSIDAGGKERHLLTKLIRTDRKVLSLTLQVPEELWPSNESCMKSITEEFKQTTLM